ncbi:MAG: A24 family peptidase [Acidobacteria bacterium]|nr:A24 family peptidase [Acidobacteriota bacterium]
MLIQFTLSIILLIPLAALITYYDVRYRRIPNVVVLATMICGMSANAAINGWRGVLSSLAGCLLAFSLMLLPHIFGALGAGDVKLFASVGAVIGATLVLPTFVIVLITGGAAAVLTSLRAGKLLETARRVSFIFGSLLIGAPTPRFPIPDDRKQTIPYGVAITFGSLISMAIFRS